MSISYEMLGIIATVVILGSVLSVATIATGDFDLGTDDIRIPNITAATSTAQTSGYYEWCYQMQRDC